MRSFTVVSLLAFATAAPQYAATSAAPATPCTTSDAALPVVETPAYTTDAALPVAETPCTTTDAALPVVETPAYTTDAALPVVETPCTTVAIETALPVAEPTADAYTPEESALPEVDEDDKEDYDVDEEDDDEEEEPAETGAYSPVGSATPEDEDVKAAGVPGPEPTAEYESYLPGGGFGEDVLASSATSVGSTILGMLAVAFVL